MKVFVITLLAIAFLILIPYLAVWAVGVVFSYHIIMTPKVWLAIVVLLALVGGSRS